MDEDTKRRTDLIHLAIAFDRNYLQPFYALICSIFSNNPPAKIYIHAIAAGISSEETDGIKDYVSRSGATIAFYTVNDNLISRFVLINNWTSAVYYRLFFPLLVPPDIKRLLYLDTDTIIAGDLRRLYDHPMNGHPLGAVYDNYVKIQPLIGISQEGEYFNSGVLLIDLEKWQEHKISEKAIDYLVKYPHHIQFVDQCALNAVLFKNWQKLDSKFNLIYSAIPEAMSMKQLRSFVADVVVIHYTLQRPWSMLCKNRLSFLYHRYLRLSPFGKTASKYTDFSWRKVPQFLKIRLLYLYFDISLLPKFWRKLKKIT